MRKAGRSLLAALIVVVAVELAVGNWLFGPALGYLAVPRNVEIEHVLTHVPGSPVAGFTRDRFGLRGDYGEPSDVDVLIVGGGTTNELYVGDGETWSEILAAQFAKAGRPVGIANAGVDGHSTVGHLRAHEVWFPNVPGLRPRWILYYVGINDTAVESQADHDDTIIASGGLRERLSRLFRNQSAIYELGRSLRRALRARDRRLVSGAADAPTNFPAVLDRRGQADRSATLLRQDADAIAAYGRRLHALVAAAGRMGARAILVTQTRGDARRDEGLLRGTGAAAIDEQLRLELYNEKAVDVCAETTALCVDLGRELSFGDGDFFDPIHTTPQGSRRIGEYLYRKLKDVLPSRPK